MNKMQFLAPFLVCFVLGCNGSNSNTSSGSGEVSPTPSWKQEADAQTVKTCDVVRSHLRSDALKAFGVPQMKERLLKISAEVTAEDAEDLAKLMPASTSYEVSDAVKRQAQQMVSDIYNRATDRSGIPAKIFEKLPEIHRSVVVSPGWLTMDIWATLAFTDGENEEVTRAIGSIGHVYLAANPDQSAYKVILSRWLKSEEKTGGKTWTGDFISLSDYVELKVPEFCKGVRTELNKEKFDTIVGPGISSRS